MAISSDQPIVVVRRKRKAGHAHHHSGAWKVAYADFVTAMMAFFLLLWLLNVTTDEQRNGIADYFDPANISRSTSGSGSILEGRTVSTPGQLTSPSSPFSLHQALPGRPEEADDSNVIDDGSSYEMAAGNGPDRSEAEAGRGARPLTDAELDRALAEREQEQFQAVEEQLRQAIQSIPELQALADNLLIDQTPEGLRIQIVDQERFSMFPTGSAEMYDQTRQLLALVAQAVSQLPNKLSIAGHTDSVPYAEGAKYDNWELSADRANASRRALIESGIHTSRIATVVGKADTDHLFPEEPTSSSNRRISIVLLREAPLMTETGGFNEVAAP